MTDNGSILRMPIRAAMRRAAGLDTEMQPTLGDEDPGFGVYVHWPFCAHKCPYCDFNSHVRRKPIDAMGFAQSICDELRYFGDRTGPRTVSSVFFGGGTPSLMPPEAVGLILDTIGEIWSSSDELEVSLEANPTSTEAGRFHGYKSAGVNRLSLGIQSLRDRDLRKLGRMHSADEARDAIALAQRVFSRMSFDIIYARMGQTVMEWQEELSEVLSLAAEHLSLYQLTIEPDTAFAKLHDAGKLVVPDPDLARQFYEVTQEMTEAAGLPAYEISNHARPGAECRHNLIYWQYGDYVGVGPGAHGRLTEDGKRIATSTELRPEGWKDLVDTKGHGLVVDKALDTVEAADEYLVMGLRLKTGISPKRFEDVAGHGFDPGRIADLKSYGFLIEHPDGRLSVTNEGFPVLNSVVADLAADPLPGFSASA